jgi:nitrous oxidase accessory protein NosD
MTIKADVDSLYLSRDAGGTLFVDGSYATSADTNDGFSATSPKKTIMGAIGAAGPGWKIRIAPGTYPENVVVPAGYEGISIEGRARDGANKTSIAPATGRAITLNCNNVDICRVEVVDTLPAVGDLHNTCIYATGYGHAIHHSAIIGVSVGCWGIWFDDVDYGIIHDCIINGSYALNGIGIFIGDDAVGCKVTHNYITKWGSGTGSGLGNNGYAIGRHADAQRTIIEENDIIDNYVGVYLYPPGAPSIEGDYIGHNNFMENANYDVYDEHPYPISANIIDENFYGYQFISGENWYDDINGDGIADNLVICGPTNKDKHPLVSPFAWKNNTGNPRVGIT